MQIQSVIHGLFENAIPRIKVVNVDPNAENTDENSAQPSKEAEEEKVSMIEMTNAVVQPGAMMIHGQDAPGKITNVIQV